LGFAFAYLLNAGHQPALSEVVEVVCRNVAALTVLVVAFEYVLGFAGFFFVVFVVVCGCFQ